MKINYDESGKILSAGIGDDFQGIEYIQPLPIDFEYTFSLGKYQINLDTLVVEKVEGWMAWTYGLEGRLNPSHPYKNAAPRSGS